jgi:AcrR family transcriptional regulator
MLTEMRAGQDRRRRFLAFQPCYIAPMPSQAERRSVTRDAIVAAARVLFGQEGFRAVSVDWIAEAAGVAKGGVYHHFSSKEAVFEAVFEAVSREVAAIVRCSAKGAPDILVAIVRSTRACGAACTDKITGRVLVQDGPVVLGQERWRELDVAYFASDLPDALKRAMASGTIVAVPAEPLARVLFGAMTETVLSVASDPTSAKSYLVSLEALVEGLRRR